MTTQEFISKAIRKHGSFYDYLKVVYTHCKIKVCIICPEHGEFWQIPSAHLFGKKCVQCGIKERSLTTEEFIKRANTVHEKGKYDYSKVVYKTLADRVCIVCKLHGEFYQDPNNHMRGGGCPICGRINSCNKKRLTTSIFIKNSISVHGKGKYDYSKVDYKDAYTKVCIICKTHGEFFQLPPSHTDGMGCKKCDTDNRKLSLSEFIKRANTVHEKGKYDYSKVQYIKLSEKVCIICKVHGEFFQKPNDHLNGCGCPNCHRSQGEAFIQKWFVENKINFIPEYSYPDLKGSGNKSLLFDFYTPHNNLLIEYDGPQHYKPVRFHGMPLKKAVEVFKKTQFHDSLKNHYCIKNNIPLLRIPYKEFIHIPEILNKNILIEAK